VHRNEKITPGFNNIAQRPGEKNINVIEFENIIIWLNLEWL